MSLESVYVRSYFVDCNGVFTLAYSGTRVGDQTQNQKKWVV